MKNNLPKVEFFIRKFLSHRPAFFTFIRPIEAALFFQAKPLMKGKILDFGCGDGFFASLIFEQNEIDAGLDLFNSRIEQAEQVGIYKKIFKFDGNKIPFKANSYNTVISNSVLEHIPNLEQNVAELHRILKPKGKLLVTVMTDQWEKNFLGNKILGKFYLKLMRRLQDHYNLLTVVQWQQIFKSAGFKLYKIETYLPPSHVWQEEIWHYLSAGSWFSYIFCKKWVIWPNWYKLINLDTYFEKKLRNSLVNKNQASAAFFILEKN